MPDDRPIGIVFMALLLGLTGSATLLVYVLLPFGLTPLNELDPWMVLFGVAYGATAAFAARQLWHRRPLAPAAFATWCVSLVAFNLYSYLFGDVKEFANPWLIPSYVLLVALFCWGYRYSRRHCRLNRRVEG